LQLGRRAELLGRNLHGMNTAQRSAIQRQIKGSNSINSCFRHFTEQMVGKEKLG
jgi:hypothetical protein